jgi:hypothetical protein
MWTLYDKHANSRSINPDPFVFSGVMTQHTFLSNYTKTCVLWCMENTNVCLGASILDSDSWNASKISGQWRVVEGGKLTLLTSQTFNAAQGPEWFIDLCSTTQDKLVGIAF